MNDEIRVRADYTQAWIDAIKKSDIYFLVDLMRPNENDMLIVVFHDQSVKPPLRHTLWIDTSRPPPDGTFGIKQYVGQIKSLFSHRFD